MLGCQSVKFKWGKIGRRHCRIGWYTSSRWRLGVGSRDLRGTTVVCVRISRLLAPLYIMNSITFSSYGAVEQMDLLYWCKSLKFLSLPECFNEFGNLRHISCVYSNYSEPSPLQPECTVQISSSRTIFCKCSLNTSWNSSTVAHLPCLCCRDCRIGSKYMWLETSN